MELEEEAVAEVLAVEGPGLDEEAVQLPVQDAVNMLGLADLSLGPNRFQVLEKEIQVSIQDFRPLQCSFNRPS